MDCIKSLNTWSTSIIQDRANARPMFNKLLTKDAVFFPSSKERPEIKRETWYVRLNSKAGQSRHISCQEKAPMKPCTAVSEALRRDLKRKEYISKFIIICKIRSHIYSWDIYLMVKKYVWHNVNICSISSYSSPGCINQV